NGMALLPPWPGDAATVLKRVAAVAGVSSEAICSRSRHRRIVSARRLALRVLAHHLGRRQVEMSRVLRLSAPGASQLLRVDERSDEARQIAIELRCGISAVCESKT